jgi:hypothetical protein
MHSVFFVKSGVTELVKELAVCFNPNGLGRSDNLMNGAIIIW